VEGDKGGQTRTNMDGHRVGLARGITPSGLAPSLPSPASQGRERRPQEGMQARIYLPVHQVETYPL
jgi:hypothetical protein